MIELHQDDVNAKNEESLRTLARAIALSQGQFSLILVRCNYESLRQHIMQKLRECCSVECQEITLHPSARTLYTTIQAALDDGQPNAAIVSGLELVNELEKMLVATNYARDEFRKHFSFPLVLWVTDEVLQKFIRVAPDFTSWAATPIGFTPTTTDLIAALYQSAESVFAAILKTGSGKFLDNTDLNLELGSPHRSELEATLKDLQHRGEALEPELEANLQFLLALDADTNDRMEESQQYYQRSLEFWQQQLSNRESDNVGSNESSLSSNPKVVERVGCLLFYLGLWWRKYATQHRSEYRFACSKARDYFRECIEIFERGDRSDLMAKFINPLGEALQKLKQWDELETIAKLAVQLHQTYPEPIRLAYGYGLLAELALDRRAYKIAETYADLALKTNAEYSEVACNLQNEYIDCGWSRLHYQNLYWLLLAQAKQHLDRVEEAIKILETAKLESKPEYDPSLYIRILETLRSLYFEQGRYQEAFRIKQEQREIEYKYGFRAFIGAGRLKIRCQVVNPQIAPVDCDKLTSIAEEIAASGRQQDISNLIERISRPDRKLTVIHGPSGVGKSSLITAGLVPALQQGAIGDRDALPIVLRGYTNWVNDLGQFLLRDLGTSLANALHEVRDINLTVPEDSPRFIINQLRKNADRNLITVLIFDQIEEFFFTYTAPKTRCILYNFLRDCLDIPYVKVILSLREDYIQYLLECERCTNLDIINNNILDKKIRYYLGNLSRKDAKAVIHSLNKRSQFYLESALIDQLVQDLAEDKEKVIPIELQLVGAQLHAEEIVTLDHYRSLGLNPKQKLVERFLQEAIKDCGEPHARVALLILYLLTDENNTRPPKTRAELATGLEEAGIESKDERDEQLDLVLEILTKSGLLMLLPEAPSDRYQLVHDYLVPFIRQKKQAEVGLEAALAREINQRKLTEQRLNRVSRQRRQVGVAVIVVTVLAFLAAGSALFAQFQRKQTQIAEIRALSSLSSALLLSNDELEAFIESVKAGKRLEELETQQKATLFGSRIISSDIRLQTLGSLQQSVYRTQERNRLEQRNGEINSVNFSPDGKTIASASDDNTIALWNIDGSLIKILTGHKGIVNSVSFSPDGKTIASASTDNTIALWSADGIKLRTLVGHRGWVKSVSFSPDGKTIASASTDNTVKLWSSDGKLLRTFRGHTNWVNCVSFSPDGEMIASASTDKTVKLWSTNGTLLRTLQGHTNWVNSVSFSPDGETIASASTDKTVKLWSIQGTLRQTLTGHTDTVKSVIFSPDGKTMASGSTDQSVKLWNAVDGKLRQTLQGHANWVNSVSFSPDGQTIASASGDRTIKLWSFDSTPLQALTQHKKEVTSVSLSPDGKMIASGSADTTVKLWTIEGLLLDTFIGHNQAVTSVSFSPNGQLVASASADKTVKLWSVNGELLQTFTGHKDWVNSVSFSPDGETIASASADNTVKLWNKNGKLLKTLPEHKGWVNSVSFSPDGKTIASASNDMTVKLWSKDGTLLKTLSSAEGHTSGVTDVSFSPDSQLIASASADNTIKLWNEDGTLHTTLYGHLGRVTSVRFHPDGQTLVSASADNTLKFWSLDGNLLRTLESDRGGINSVRFSPDGKTIASANDENAVILWNFDLDDLLLRGCAWLHDYLKNPNANIKPEENRRICSN